MTSRIGSIVDTRSLAVIESFVEQAIAQSPKALRSGVDPTV
jgi:hypothetical protein